MTLMDDMNEALVIYDVVTAGCPLRKALKRVPSVCPRCRATASDSCGVENGAAWQFIKSARTAIERARGSHDQ